MVPSWVLSKFYLETIHLSWALCFCGSMPRDFAKQLSKKAEVCSSEILTAITCWLSPQTFFESRTKPSHGHSDPSCYLSPPLPQTLFLPSSSIRGWSGTQAMNPLHFLHSNLISLETKTSREVYCQVYGQNYLTYSFYPLWIPHSTDLNLCYLI